MVLSAKEKSEQSKPVRLRVRLIKRLRDVSEKSANAIQDVSKRLLRGKRKSGIRLSGFSSTDGSKLSVFVSFEEIKKSDNGISIGPDPELNNYEMALPALCMRMLRLSADEDNIYLENICPDAEIIIDRETCSPFSPCVINNGSVITINGMDLDITKVKR